MGYNWKIERLERFRKKKKKFKDPRKVNLKFQNPQSILNLRETRRNSKRILPLIIELPRPPQHDPNSAQLRARYT